VELGEPRRGHLRGFNLHIDGGSAVVHREVQDRKLLFDAAVELAVILVPAAGGQDKAAGELIEKSAHGPRARARVVKEIQSKLEKGLASAGLSAGVFQQGRDIRHA